MGSSTSLDQLVVYAAMASRLDLVKERLDRGGSPVYVDAVRGSALMQACHRGAVDIVRLLLEAGADPHQRGLWNKSAAELAVEGNNGDVIALLRERGVAVVLADRISPPDAESPQPQVGNWCILSADATQEQVLWPFEVHCVVDCCGWNAYDFSTNFVSGCTADQKQRECLLAHLSRLIGQEADADTARHLLMIRERVLNAYGSF